MHYLDLPIWKQFFFTCGDYLLSNLILFLWLRSLFYSLPAKQLFQKLPTLLFLAPVEAAFNWNAAKIIQNAPLMWLIYVLIALFFTLFSMWVWHRPFWHCLAAVCIAEMMESSLSVVFIDVLYACFPMLSPEQISPAGSMCLFWLTLPFFHFALTMLVGRLWPRERFCTCLEHTDTPCRTALLLAALATAFVALNHMQYGVQSTYLAEYLLVVAVMAMLVTALVFHLTVRDMDQRRLKLQKDMLTQQQLYEQTLEELQQELKTFRHDCRNLLTGLANEQDTDSLSRSLLQLEAGFEKRLGEKIWSASQIGNLHIPQVRGLLLSKISQMEEQNISCRLEVLYPVNHAAMDIWDLIRCLGILTDNAAEAALDTGQPWVEILLLQEGPALKLRISNPWTGTADPECFWQAGWSTKGQGRGMGLFSYQKILKKYPYASSASSWNNGIFTQELTIEGTGGRT